MCAYGAVGGDGEEKFIQSATSSQSYVAILQDAPEMCSTLETVNGKCNDDELGVRLQLWAKNAEEMFVSLKLFKNFF